MIYVEDELIKLNGVVLPGLVKSIEVIETAKVDEQEVEGSATKPKQATGYEDAKVNIELIIDDTPSQTKYQRYATLRAIFRSPGQSVPQPIPIISEDTAAHGVEKVIFKKLSHKGENKRGQLTATLELWEYIPQTITAKSGSSSGSGKSGGGAASNLKADYKSYLSNERGKSPARDDADATAAMNKVTAMPYYWYEYKLTVIDRFGNPDTNYPALPGIKSKKQFKAGAVVAVALPYGDLTPAIIGEVEL